MEDGVEGLLAGPRDRRLCLELAMMPPMNFVLLSLPISWRVP